ncbi:hypothetical protein [Lactococcus ileimucosae]|uniref:hypothetical protein n=1 Tax=Lactococcus ileimucosae TaxID=2941329 RepID=UPI002043ACA5|nr:hypothetical protein [Lactococcus ileimucosae]
MNKEQKRKLGVLAVLGLALLVGGTFAFTAFNQRVTNDRLRDNEFEVGGRVHDYYNRDTENKDVFVENYGEEEIMVRIRLSEFMDIRKRGATDFEPLVGEAVRDEVDTWTTWKPNADNINQRQTGTDSAFFNDYSNLTFGWDRGEEFAPWYLPTFNHVENDPRAAAAGHARDYFTSDATDGVTNGATHPGDGTDAYWTEDSPTYDNSAGDWFGSQVTHEVAQHLQQERPPMTMEQWENDLDIEEKIGDFWVIDHQTGWAYWASKLQAGETTSYLLDAAQMTEMADDIRGSYYYGIHVSSHLVRPENSDDFLGNDDEGEHHEHLADFLEGVRNNAMDDEYTNGGSLPAENPEYDVNSAPEDFNFGLMNPGRLFTIDNQRFRYLEDMGDGNHLIIRDSMIRHSTTTWNAQPTELQNWYSALIQAEPALEPMVQPVTIPNPAPNVAYASITWTGTGTRWLPANLASFPAVAGDLTTVDEGDGVKQAFALSLADVTKLSQLGGAFSNHAERAAGGQGIANGWWLRTPGASGRAWLVSSIAYGFVGQLLGNRDITGPNAETGVRPALILHQAGA